MHHVHDVTSHQRERHVSTRAENAKGKVPMHREICKYRIDYDHDHAKTIRTDKDLMSKFGRVQP